MRVSFLISISDPRFPFLFYFHILLLKKNGEGGQREKGREKNRKIKRKEAKTNETVY